MTVINEAIFPIAGLGTRHFPMTKTCPKELLPLMNKPLIHGTFNDESQRHG